MIHALVDANIFVSYLLNKGEGETINFILTSAILGNYTLLIPGILLDELIHKVETKPYLIKKINKKDLEELVSILKEVGSIIPPIVETIPQVVRDPKDDYLLAYALIGNAHYLVSGDEDLIVLKEVEGVKIVSPIQFKEIISKNKI
jgi:putative PIN family toxin of toxin-antitoxin system